MHALGAQVADKGVDFPDHSGRTPLMYAVIGNKVLLNSDCWSQSLKFH